MWQLFVSLCEYVSYSFHRKAAHWMMYGLCFLLNSEPQGLVGTQSVFTEISTQCGHEASYRTRILRDAHVGRRLVDLLWNLFSSILLSDRGEMKTCRREGNFSLLSAHISRSTSL